MAAKEAQPCRRGSSAPICLSEIKLEPPALVRSSNRRSGRAAMRVATADPPKLQTWAILPSHVNCFTYTCKLYTSTVVGCLTFCRLGMLLDARRCTPLLCGQGSHLTEAL